MLANSIRLRTSAVLYLYTKLQFVNFFFISQRLCLSIFYHFTSILARLHKFIGKLGFCFSLALTKHILCGFWWDKYSGHSIAHFHPSLFWSKTFQNFVYATWKFSILFERITLYLTFLVLTLTFWRCIDWFLRIL